MKRYLTNLLQVLSGLALTLVFVNGTYAQTPAQATHTESTVKPTVKNEEKKTVTKKEEVEPTSATTGEDTGDYNITSSIEVGYRGLRVRGDQLKFRSDLNLKAGPRLFDTSFLVKAKDGKNTPFETFLVTATGWGADPYGNMRMSVENPKWYRFEGNYRRFKYFRYLNNIANPLWLFTGFPVAPNPVTGLHGYNTRTHFGDFDLTILPKNETIRFTVGYSPERYSGPYFTTYHVGGNEFQALTNAKSRANDFRLGADGKLGPVDWTFLQGFRRFRDDSFVDTVPQFLNPNPTNVARFSTFTRNEPTRGSVDYTRFSVHTLIAKQLDLTARVAYSKATSTSTFFENMTGTNFNTRIGSGSSAQLGPPNILLLGQYNIPSTVKRPNTLADFGATWLATDKFRISNTFRVEDFTIDGIATFNDVFSVQRGTTIDTRAFSNLNAFKTTKYRKYQDTIEGDYQFNRNYSIHFGYRYGNRHEEQSLTGYAIGSNAPTLLTPLDLCTSPVGAGCEEFEVEENHTHAFFGGFKARPAKNWTLYFDAEHGTADNVFTRIGNYDYTNIRAKSRYAPNRKLSFNLALITRNNANPSEIAGLSVNDFGVSIRSRTFQSSLDWLVNPKLSISTGYNYNWVNSDSTIDYFYQVPPATAVFHHFGHALYFQRNNYFYLDLTARLHHRMTLYSSYRINQDNGQGNRLSTPTEGTTITGGVRVPGVLNPINPAVLGGTLITSYPNNFQSPEARLAIRVNRHLDWNLGYQYFSYNEDGFLRTFPGSPRAQNYHAHMPYMSLRLYIGRKE
jgi:hypothetical protein